MDLMDTYMNVTGAKPVYDVNEFFQNISKHAYYLFKWCFSGATFSTFIHLQRMEMSSLCFTTLRKHNVEKNKWRLKGLNPGHNEYKNALKTLKMK